MACLTQSKLPVIDIENLKPGTESWMLGCHKVRDALEEYGCFMVVSHGLPQDFKNEVYTNLKALFDLPIETKMNNTSDKPLHGYLGASSSRPLYESMGIEHATCLEDVESFAKLMWPNSGNHQFRAPVNKISTESGYLQRTLTWLARGVCNRSAAVVELVSPAAVTEISDLKEPYRMVGDDDDDDEDVDEEDEDEEYEDEIMKIMKMKKLQTWSFRGEMTKLTGKVNGR
ncbi:hypothetical protein QVD17_28025 [Tagetes erecta]|uniref:Non-haem dioxygenase N-terminal domain-containing protein n=1 Tax=Tagetes erecta TaxID=13708 RepID=A0AAD8NSC7_TARER|nr:hypothetical protein QVD17_28025 [Tagetes erecta]